jgi:acetyl esterase/lipase
MRSGIAASVSIVIATLAASPVAAASVTVTEGIAYGELPRQKLDLYRPDMVDDGTPVIVFFYGGGWERGDRGDLRRTGEALAVAGLIVAVPDYRLYPDAAFPEFVEDGALAVAHVWRTLRRADGGPRPILVGGHSAGAFNAAMLALDESYLSGAGVPSGALAGAVLLSGPYDMSGALPPPFNHIFPRETRDGAAAADFVDGTDPPILLLTVDADDVVDPRNTYRLAEAIEAGGGDVSVSAYPGERDHLATFLGLADPNSVVRRDVEGFIAAAVRQWRQP